MSLAKRSKTATLRHHNLEFYKHNTFAGAIGHTSTSSWYESPIPICFLSPHQLKQTHTRAREAADGALQTTLQGVSIHLFDWAFHRTSCRRVDQQVIVGDQSRDCKNCSQHTPVVTTLNGLFFPQPEADPKDDKCDRKEEAYPHGY